MISTYPEKHKSEQWPLQNWEFAILSHVAQPVASVVADRSKYFTIPVTEGSKAGRPLLPDTELWRSKVSPFFVLTKLIIRQTELHFVLAVIKIAYQHSITRGGQLYVWPSGLCIQPTSNIWFMMSPHYFQAHCVLTLHSLHRRDAAADYFLTYLLTFHPTPQDIFCSSFVANVKCINIVYNVFADWNENIIFISFGEIIHQTRLIYTASPRQKSPRLF